ncbi:putative disease resistance RPP13-like protein 1 [Olea europaea var. sylvestris]|uniref:putative disease resistance RPP13-like protein 1 n=1 Tax=Olea europaea var. sylvestris TaxID=158386 RepID=UPI000C1D15E8|nr:putative disease resistance RPP13-like protein 1 [Olea europaea var. sylvestris]
MYPHASVFMSVEADSHKRYFEFNIGDYVILQACNAYPLKMLKHVYSNAHVIALSSHFGYHFAFNIEDFITYKLCFTSFDDLFLLSFMDPQLDYVDISTSIPSITAHKDKIDVILDERVVLTNDDKIQYYLVCWSSICYSNCGHGRCWQTTLVQLVYNDERLKHKFDLKAWVCVKDNFNAFKVTKCILESVSSGKSDYRNFNMLQVTLKENLSNKKFLVVLDDIWNENYGDWDILRRPFLSGKSGSKIIITTRQEGVAKIMSHIPAYHVTELSEDDAVSLLVQQAFGGKNIDANLDLRDNCKSVVRRCKNLPLAVKALQGLLRTKGPKEWEEVLESKIWMADEKSEILSALKLSYQYLPPQLKRCFAYCALFPKDYEFDKLELANLWMAEGFVQESKKEVGSQYFDELLATSFFQ